LQCWYVWIQTKCLVFLLQVIQPCNNLGGSLSCSEMIFCCWMIKLSSVSTRSLIWGPWGCYSYTKWTNIPISCSSNQETI
jgi:hypothetical protein